MRDATPLKKKPKSNDARGTNLSPLLLVYDVDRGAVGADVCASLEVASRHILCGFAARTKQGGGAASILGHTAEGVEGGEDVGGAGDTARGAARGLPTAEVTSRRGHSLSNEREEAVDNGRDGNLFPPSDRLREIIVRQRHRIAPLRPQPLPTSRRMTKCASACRRQSFLHFGHKEERERTNIVQNAERAPLMENWSQCSQWIPLSFTPSRHQGTRPKLCEPGVPRAHGAACTTPPKQARAAGLQG